MNQCIIAGDNDQISTSANEYIRIAGSQANVWNSNVNLMKQLHAGNGYIHSLRVKLSVAPANGGSYTFTVFKNGIATALTVTVTGTETEGFDGNNEVTFTGGSDWSLECDPSSSPAPTGTPRLAWSLHYQDTDACENSIVIGGRNNQLNPSTTEYNYMYGGDLWRTEPAVFPPIVSRQEISRPGVLKNLYVKVAADPSPGNYALSVTSGASQITATINSGSTAANNTSSTLSVNSGQNFNIESVPSSSPTARHGRWGCVFASDDPYEHLELGGSRDPLNLGATEYNFIHASNTNWLSTIINRQSLTGCVTLHSLFVELNQTNPMDQYDFTIMKNGIATALTVSIANGVADGNNVSDFLDCAPFDLISIEATPTGTPPGGVNLRCFWGFICRTVQPFPSSQLMVGYGN